MDENGPTQTHTHMHTPDIMNVTNFTQTHFLGDNYYPKKGVHFLKIEFATNCPKFPRKLL